MPAELVRFIELLRSHDLRISPAETLDAMAVADSLGYLDRQQLQDGLAMALAKTPEEDAVFRQCFDRYFSQQLAQFEKRREDREAAAEDDGSLLPAPTGDDREVAADHPDDTLLARAAEDDPQLAALLQTPLMRQLQGNQRSTLSLAIRAAGEDVGLRDIRIFTQKGQYTRRMLEALGETQLRDTLLDLDQRGSPATEALRRYRDILREQVREHVEHEYLLHAEGHNRRFMDELLTKARLGNLEQRYLDRVETLVRRMARQLADRHARRQTRYRRGRLDMGRTLRRGVASDGVLFETHWRRIKKQRPQVLAICDVSGSVAAYATFLLLFLYSLQDILPRVRSFAFSSRLGEVSDLFREHSVQRAIELVNWRYGGATDYGNSLLDFARLAMEDIDSRTTVIVLGDARNNHGDARVDILRDIGQRCRRLIWLNPESRRAWGTGDSEMLRYRSACHVVAPCSNLAQLQRAIDQVLRSTR